MVLTTVESPLSPLLPGPRPNLLKSHFLKVFQADFFLTMLLNIFTFMTIRDQDVFNVISMSSWTCLIGSFIGLLGLSSPDKPIAAAAPAAAAST